MKNEGNADAKVEVSGSQGIQVGNDNVLNLVQSAKAKLEPSSLGFLSPEVSVARLRQMSHDEVVDLFARATPEDAAEVIRALAMADDATVVSVLADLNLRKAAALIEPIAAEFPWLKHLPAAATTIAHQASALGWSYLGDSGRLARVSDQGYCRRYPNGWIYWSDKTGANPVLDVVGQCFKVATHGFPVSAEAPAPPSPFGTTGTSQRFQHSSIYSSGRGTWVVPMRMLACYSPMSGPASWLGFPVAGMVYKEVDRGMPGRAMCWYRQRFEGGAIYRPVNSSAIPVRSSFIEYLNYVYGADQWIPEEEEDEVEGPGQTATRQPFHVNQGRKRVVYSSEHGLVGVSSAVDDYYIHLGGRCSWLGLPKADRVDGKQEFEGGVVYSSGGRAPIAVRKTVVEMISRKGLDDEIGWPLAEDQAIGGNESDRVQLFANGAAVLRNGQWEILLRA